MNVKLPKKKNCTIQVSTHQSSGKSNLYVLTKFLQAILCSRKRFLRKFEVRNIKIPHWPELSIARLWSEAIMIPRFLEYMPDEWSLANIKKIEREYFWSILISLAPE